MERPALEVAQILRRFESQYRKHTGGLSRDQARVVSALTACRTAVLGGHVEACDACGHRRIAYNSCRNRHCPKCQAAATARWLERERGYLLPVPYAHVVFTLPDVLAPILLQNPRVGYGLLFQAAAQTLLEIAADPKHLGAQIGFVAILHTWGQTLLHHPHLHCLVPAGGLVPGESRWVSCRHGFFLPVRVLSALFRGKYLALLERSHRARALVFHGKLSPLADPSTFARLLSEARRRPWVVYAKPPFGGPEPVLKYLARYTHRIAISNTRLLSVSNDAVTFTWKDYRQGSRSRTMRLAPLEFVRRFLLHVLPKGFVRIRRYGILANCQRHERLARCRELLGIREETPANSVATCSDPSDNEPDGPSTAVEIICDACQQGRMRVIDWIPPLRLSFARAPPALHRS
jgi:hypothetical protein